MLDCFKQIFRLTHFPAALRPSGSGVYSKISRPLKSREFCASGAAVLWAAALLVVSLGTGTTAFGQAVFGSISGTVTDSSGAVVPAATVTITDVAKGISQTVKADPSGFYRADRLIPAARGAGRPGRFVCKGLGQWSCSRTTRPRHSVFARCWRPSRPRPRRGSCRVVAGEQGSRAAALRHPDDDSRVLDHSECSEPFRQAGPTHPLQTRLARELQVLQAGPSDR